MLSSSPSRIIAAIALSTAMLSPLASAHFDDKEPQQSYRQSLFALLASNFGPIVAMVKGEIPWNQEMLEGWSGDLSGVSQLNFQRGFAPGSEQGTTRAKPEIWENSEDFAAKWQDLQSAVADLQSAVATTDRKQITAAVGGAGKTCKACHDEYKAKNYLY